jgi:hypothetical protein
MYRSRLTRISDRSSLSPDESLAGNLPRPSIFLLSIGHLVMLVTGVTVTKTSAPGSAGAGNGGSYK